MARIKGEGGFLSGMVGTVSFYKRKDLEGVILRTKGGPSKRQMKTSPKFANTRKRNVEFGICSKMGAQIRHRLSSLVRLSDYNSSLLLNSLASIILKTDVEHVLGERSICLSKNRDYLKGFSFNKINTLDTYFKGLYGCTVFKDAFSATIDISPLTPAIHFANTEAFQYYRWILEVAVIADYEFNAEKGMYLPSAGYYTQLCKTKTTPWLSLTASQEALSLVIDFPLQEPLLPNETVVVGFGIEFGKALSDAVIVAAKNAGAAKIVAVV